MHTDLFCFISNSFGTWENLLTVFHIFGMYIYCYSISLIHFTFPVILDTSVIDMVLWLC